MDVIPDQAAQSLSSMDWRDSESYTWIMALPRPALAWEFVRRSPAYRDAFQTNQLAVAGARSEWPLVRLEDPRLDARVAVPAWRAEAHDTVLPLRTSASAQDAIRAVLDVHALHCRMTVYRETDSRSHVIFADQGRQLHLDVESDPSAGPTLMTPALAPIEIAAKRSLAMRRLADLAKHGELRAHLYPPESRAARFARILQALDGALAGAKHRDIAIGLFGELRVSQDWAAPDNHLRDHVRRAVAQGRAMMSEGFTRLLG